MVPDAADEPDQTYVDSVQGPGQVQTKIEVHEQGPSVVGRSCDCRTNKLVLPSRMAPSRNLRCWVTNKNSRRQR